MALFAGLSFAIAQPGGNPPLAPSVTGSLPMQAWRTEDQGASNINWAVVVHPKTGFVYVANQTGALEFDGVRWRLIPLPRGGPVRSVAVASDGRVWIAGSAQICVLEPGPLGELQPVDMGVRLSENPPPVSDGTIAESSREEDADASLSDPRLIGIAPDMIPAPDGIYFVLPRRIVRFRNDGGLDVWRKPSETTALGWWSEGALHVVPASGGIQRLEAGEFKPIAVRGGPRVLDSAPHPEGGWLWLAVAGPIHVFNGQRKQLASPEAAALFRADRPRCALILPGGGSAYGTINHGVVILDAKGQIVQIIDRARGLPANRVNGIAADGEGGLWLAMHSGIVRVQLDTPLRQHGIAQGLSGSPRQLARLAGRLYVTHSEGVAWRDEAGQFHDVPGVTAAMHELSVSGDEALVAGLGLFALRADATVSPVGNNTFRFGVSHARARPDLAFVFGAFDVQFWQRQPNDSAGAPRWSAAGTFANVPTGADDLYEDGRGFLWLVTRDARVRRIDVRGGVRADAPVEIFGAEQGLPPLPRPGAVRFLPIGDELFVTHRRGNWRYDAAQNRFVADSRLAAGPVAAAPDANGAWLYYPRPQPRLERVDFAAGGAWKITAHPLPVLGNLAVHSLYVDEPSHTLWIAGEGQLTSFDLNASAGPALPPLRATIRRVLTLAGKPLWHHAPDTADETPAKQPLTLAADQRAVRVEFAAAAYQTDLRNRPPLRFRTRVEGIDAGWSTWSDAPYRDLTNLPDGALVIELQARDLAGRESAAARLAFSVLPPWWRTPPARAAWILLAGGAVVGVVALRTRSLRQRAERLEVVVQTRTEELRVQNLELARLHQMEMDEKIVARLAEEKAHLELLRYQLNPHFLLNAFTTLRSLVFSSPVSAGEMVGRLAAFCRLALTRSDEAGATVAEEAHLVETYLATEQARWRDSLKWSIEVDPAVSTRRLPPFLLQPLVENAVKYGGRTSPDLLEVRVRITDDEAGGLRIEVANSGAWVEPGSTHHTADSTGLGLENLRQRLRRYYRDAHSLDIRHADGWVRILLHLRVPAA